MNYICHKIVGVPYGQNKTKGRVDALPVWTQAVIDQTKRLPKIKNACVLRVTFLLPRNKFPSDLPYGSDLDNLLKRFLDALNQTVFSDTQGKDSCIISLSATKARVEFETEAGALLEVIPIILD
jgi:hypothetical protein